MYFIIKCKNILVSEIYKSITIIVDQNTNAQRVTLLELHA